MYIQHISQIWIRFLINISRVFFVCNDSFAYSIAGLEYSIIGTHTH